MMDWTGRSRGGLRPEDVFDSPHQWRLVTRQEAAEWCDRRPVVAVLYYGPTMLRTTWFGQQHPMHYGPGPSELHNEDYFVYEGHELGLSDNPDRDERRTERQRPSEEVPRTGRGRQETPRPQEKPREEPRKEETKKQIVCELTNADVTCGHGRKPNKDGVLEVVPREAMDFESFYRAKPDVVTLHADLKGGCGNHARWEAGGKVTVGNDAKYEAKPHWFKAWHVIQAVKPKRTEVSVASCDAPTRHYTIVEYPSDQVEIEINYNLKAGKSEEPVGPNGPAPGSEGEGEKKFGAKIRWRPDDGLGPNLGALKSLFSAAERIAYVEKAITAIAAPTKETKFEFLPEVTGKFIAGYVEHTDWRAFLRIEASLAATLFEAEATIPFGPLSSIPGWLKKFTTDFFGDAYLYIKLSGKIEVSGKWTRDSPDSSKGSALAEGSVGVTIGATLFLMKKTTLNIDINGSTEIKPSAEGSFEGKDVVVEYDIMWEGLKLQVSVEAAWGLVSFKKEWEVMERRSMIGGKKKWLPFNSGEGGGEKSLPTGTG